MSDKVDYLQRAKEILSFLLKNVTEEFDVSGREDSSNIYLKAFISKSDYNFLSRNKTLDVSLKAIVMAFGAKVNKKIHVDFVVKNKR